LRGERPGAYRVALSRLRPPSQAHRHSFLCKSSFLSFSISVCLSHFSSLTNIILHDTHADIARNDHSQPDGKHAPCRHWCVCIMCLRVSEQESECVSARALSFVRVCSRLCARVSNVLCGDILCHCVCACVRVYVLLPTPNCKNSMPKLGTCLSQYLYVRALCCEGQEYGGMRERKGYNSYTSYTSYTPAVGSHGYSYGVPMESASSRTLEQTQGSYVYEQPSRQSKVPGGHDRYHNSCSQQ